MVPGFSGQAKRPGQEDPAAIADTTDPWWVYRGQSSGEQWMVAPELFISGFGAWAQDKSHI